MGNLIMKFCSGETDLNANGLNDRDEILKVVEQYIMRKELKENEQKGEKVLKRMLKFNTHTHIHTHTSKPDSYCTALPLKIPNPQAGTTHFLAL